MAIPAKLVGEAGQGVEGIPQIYSTSGSHVTSRISSCLNKYSSQWDQSHNLGYVPALPLLATFCISLPWPGSTTLLLPCSQVHLYKTLAECKIRTSSYWIHVMYQCYFNVHYMYQLSTEMMSSKIVLVLYVAFKSPPSSVADVMISETSGDRKAAILVQGAGEQFPW